MKINIYQPRVEPWLDSFLGWCSGHFFLEAKIIKFKLAMLPGHLFSMGTAVAMRILFPRYPLPREFIYFPPVNSYAQRS